MVYRATRSDVAAAAGVSTAVVSYVVNGGPRPVSKVTREKVQAAIEALGYRPHAAARALAAGDSGVFGLVLPDTGNPYFANVAQHAVEAATRRGVEMLLLQAKGDADNAVERVRRLPVGLLDGVLVATAFDEDSAEQLLTLGIPVVFTAQHLELSTGCVYMADLRSAARLGVEHLIFHGRKHIAFFGATEGTDQRILGWRDGLEAAGLPEGLVLDCGFDVARSFEVARDVDLQSVDGLLVGTDQQGWAVLRALGDRGISVPDDIAVVSIDGIEQASYLRPSLTSVSEPTSDIVRAAVNELINLAGTGGLPPAHCTVYPTTLIARESCGCSESR